MKSNLERSLRAKSGGGVKTCGAPGGQPGRHGCDREEYHRHRGKGCWVGGFDAHEHGGHSACESEGRDQAGCDTEGSETQTLTHDKLENVSGLSTQGHSNAYLSGALPHDRCKHAIESNAREQRRDDRERSDEEQ
jgi:hypothetical protein